jgi:hypothetical protein
MGRTRLCFDRQLERLVAVKTPKDDAAAAILTQEARLGSRLDHPGIATIFDAGVDDEGVPFLAMRLIDGQTLRAKAPSLSTSARVRVLAQAAAAVAHAHGRGVVHRDLKPDNIMVGGRGEVVVVDWGLAAVVGDATASRGSGTRGYLPPEALTSLPTPGFDVYALGVCLRELMGDVSDRRLGRIVARATAADPAARYPDAGALADDLMAFLDERPLHDDDAAIVRMALWLKRHQRLALGVGVAGVFVLAGAVIGATRVQEAEARQARSELVAGLAARTAERQRLDDAVAVGDVVPARASAQRLRLALQSAFVAGDDVVDDLLQLAGIEAHLAAAGIPAVVRHAAPVCGQARLIRDDAGALAEVCLDDGRLRLVDLTSPADAGRVRWQGPPSPSLVDLHGATADVVVAATGGSGAVDVGLCRFDAATGHAQGCTTVPRYRDVEVEVDDVFAVDASVLRRLGDDGGFTSSTPCDGQEVIARGRGDDGTVVVVCPDDLRVGHDHWPVPRLRQEHPAITDVAVVADHVVAGSAYGMIHVWNGPGRATSIPTGGGAIRRVVVAGDVVVALDDAGAAIVLPGTRSVLARIDGAAIASDGPILDALALADDRLLLRTPTARLDVTLPPQRLRRLQHSGGVAALLVHDGEVHIGDGDGLLVSVDARHGWRRHQRRLGDNAIKVLRADGDLVLVSAALGDTEVVFAHEPLRRLDRVAARTLTLWPDGRLVSGGYIRGVVVADTAAHDNDSRLIHPLADELVAFAPAPPAFVDETPVVALTAAGALVLLSLAADDTPGTTMLHPGPFSAIASSSSLSSSLLAAGPFTLVGFDDALVEADATAHPFADPCCLAVAASGHIAIGDRSGQALVLRDGVPQLALLPHRPRLSALVFDADGALWSAGWDGAVRRYAVSATSSP